MNHDPVPPPPFHFGFPKTLENWAKALGTGKGLEAGAVVIVVLGSEVSAWSKSGATW